MVAPAGALPIPDSRNPQDILERVQFLIQINSATLKARLRTKNLMNGGEAGLKALLGERIKLTSDMVPAINLMDSGLRRLGQKIGRMPDLRIMPSGHKDSERARKSAEKRERIVTAYDLGDNRDEQMPQLGRWVPGYGYAAFVIRERMDANGFPYPSAELRDPFNVYPGTWGVNSQPEDMAVITQVPHRTLARLYPKHSAAIMEGARSAVDSASGGLLLANTTTKSWSNQSGNGLQVAEYFDRDGTWVVLPEKQLVVDFVPNPLRSGPRFVLIKRFVFDQLIGQYDQIVGLMAMMAKLNVLSVIALEDAVFTETNVMGEMESGQYSKGRNSINFLTPGTNVDKPIGQIPFQMFQQIDRIERHLRIGASYPVQDDGANPANTAATGRGIERLDFNPSLEISEYQLAIGKGIQRVDDKLLEWDETLYKNQEKPLSGHIKGAPFNESYIPTRDINGNHNTRRIYGVMAGWDEPQKIVTGLQLMQGEVIDVETMQENLDGLENLTLIRERIRRKKAEDAMFEALLVDAQNQDPTARALLAEVINNQGKDFESVLKKYLTPDEPELSPEEEAFLQAQGGLGGPGGGDPAQVQGPPPDVTTVLSQLRQGGGLGGGVQTVGQL